MKPNAMETRFSSTRKITRKEKFLHWLIRKLDNLLCDIEDKEWDKNYGVKDQSL